MEHDEAEEILGLAALAESGLKVEFLKRPKSLEAIAFVEPRSTEHVALCLRLLVIEKRGEQAGASRYIRFTTVTEAIAHLSDLCGGDGLISPFFRTQIEKIFDACEHHRFYKALKVVRDKMELEF
ncbi:hypothetical protein J5277_28770 [Rhizobium sp. 16-449-1b]|uniref:hypothetical protein n=1 Tax=Rhizobium sp. 16-449-1b TaxID=2819989 RepID=UPI001ADC72C7|nr:hypothetical protein [Rhizobium sp. 16-449-1b]MBO9198126.1 hypothetical protein [Rhizobium sp. 16-449-1b]